MRLDNRKTELDLLMDHQLFTKMIKSTGRRSLRKPIKIEQLWRPKKKNFASIIPQGVLKTLMSKNSWILRRFLTPEENHVTQQRLFWPLTSTQEATPITSTIWSKEDQGVSMLTVVWLITKPILGNTRTQQTINMKNHGSGPLFNQNVLLL